MSETAAAFDGPGLHVIATDTDVDDVADLLVRLQVPVEAVIDGDLALSPYQDAAENLFLGHEPRRFGLVDRSRMRREAAEVFSSFGLDLSPDGPPTLRPEEHLLFALARVAVHGARACAINADRLDVASESVVRASRHLMSRGVRVVVAGAAVGAFLGHAHTITVVSLASGVARVAGTCEPGPLASEEVVELLLAHAGADVGATGERAKQLDPRPVVPGAATASPPVLIVSGWTVPALPGVSAPVADGVSFDLRGGEITTLTGHGARELALSLFGASMGPATRGSVRVRRPHASDPRLDVRDAHPSDPHPSDPHPSDAHASGAGASAEHPVAAHMADAQTADARPGDAPVEVGSLTVAEAIAAGISYGSERPLSYDVGLLGGIPTSVSGATLKRLAASGVIDARRSYRTSRRPLVAALRGGDDPSAFTDVLRSWSAAGPAVVILDEPFLNDRAARLSVVRELAARGAAILIVSSRPADIAESAHRLLVARSGAVLERADPNGLSVRDRFLEILRTRLRSI
ncbi:sugar ABC transporter ATP-binding protein [Okibacterium fritillariae]|uniref:ABC-type sugar transport system, ATPase component n=1 Tax=Okibacterium fritillariae TaxID=123320 RepID=A0A1T5IS46_9MICO|nr:hypothetical protein [Okibacterium fritillariae]SKC41932.1 ABC-type sugar transport system, ATPase component [Okibacterium fritillariae]